MWVLRPRQVTDLVAAVDSAVQRPAAVLSGLHASWLTVRGRVGVFEAAGWNVCSVEAKGRALRAVKDDDSRNDLLDLIDSKATLLGERCPCEPLPLVSAAVLQQGVRMVVFRGVRASMLVDS